MKKLTFLLLAFLLIQPVLFSQNCLPGETLFSTQEEIDNFQINYPGCTVIEGKLNITGNNINNLEGLSVLTAIGGDLWVDNNDSINNLTGLHNITSIGGKLSIGGLDAIENLVGLEGLTSVNGMLEICFNNSLINLSGLNSLSVVSGVILIHTNPLLSDLLGLENLSAAGGGLSLHRNDNLTDLTGLENLHSIDGHITINDNENLESLNGINNIQSSSITNLYISDNDNLSTCEVQSICDYLASPSGTIEISNNNTGCNTQEEVEEACGNISIEEFKSVELFEIFPNPAKNKLTIKNRKELKIKEINIFNQLGEKIYIIDGDKNNIDISKLDKGIYIVEIKVENNNYRKKLIVN
ncbi:MAG: T9SS type A sorting domain-containing protein [Bacteroidales bacterium]|nr:T9SS type A sorting domain-containing protein [Bacteroidales bacterium]